MTDVCFAVTVNGVVASSGEIFEFPIPIEDKVLQADGIMEEEKMVHSEFFDGRPLKTPERYLKIRNYILDCWCVVVCVHTVVDVEQSVLSFGVTV